MEWTTVQAWIQEMEQLRSQPYTVKSITLLLAMVSTMVAIYVADRLWQDAADRVYLIQKLDKRNGKNISGCGVLGLPTVKSLYSGCGRFGLICLFGTQAAVEPSTCDGLTVDQIIARKISRKHVSLLGKMKEVHAFERELLEYVDMVKLACEENDAELESVGLQYFS
ncbi:hypothetical protein EV1_008975 [Malus domestica]